MHFAHEFLGSPDPFGVLLRDDFAPHFVDSGAIAHLNEPNAHEVAASDGDAGKFDDPGIGIERDEHVQPADRFKPSRPLAAAMTRAASSGARSSSLSPHSSGSSSRSAASAAPARRAASSRRRP